MGLDTVFVDLLGRLEGVSFIVGFGTALGIHRDGRLIPGDSDIDVCIRRPQIPAVKKAFAGWPLLLERPRHATNQYLYNPGVVVDVSVWKPHDGGIEWWGHSFPRTMFNAVWVDTQYGRVPLPDDVETVLEGLYGDWRTPV